MLRAGRMGDEVVGRTAPRKLCLSIPRSACGLPEGQGTRGSVYAPTVPERGGGEQAWEF